MSLVGFFLLCIGLRRLSMSLSYIHVGIGVCTGPGLGAGALGWLGYSGGRFGLAT